MCGDHTQFYRYSGGAFEKVSDFLPPPEGWESPSGVGRGDPSWAPPRPAARAMTQLHPMVE